MNKYFTQKQFGTFLDVSYDEFDQLPVPEILSETSYFDKTNEFPKSDDFVFDPAQPTLLHSIWNLDPTWKQESNTQRILLIEPSQFTDWPLSPKRWEFVVHWARQIPNLKIFVGEWSDLFPESYDPNLIIYRDYPALSHWQGSEEPREWLYLNTSGYFKNFFSFWKVAEKELIKI